MSFGKIVTTLVLGCATLGLIACCESSCTDGTSVDSSAMAPATVKESIKAEAAPTTFKSIVHFNHNSAALNVENKEIIATIAKKLLENPSLHLCVVGHTDERGADAYNVALGKRRAKAVARELELKGIDASRITVMSVGTAQPVATEHNELAWSQNRRAELSCEAQD